MPRHLESITLDAGPDFLPRMALSARLSGWLLTLVILVLFSVSGGLLWVLDYNYDGLLGAAYTKIHPVTYLTLLAFAVTVVLHRNPAAHLMRMMTANPGALLFIIASVLLGLFIVLDGRRGIATVFDTYLTATLIALMLLETGSAERRRIELMMHVLMACNALLALTELALDTRFFPFRFDGVAFETDRRSAALLGHPLENAMATATYLVILINGGGRHLAPVLRMPASLLQLAGLVAFGGRSALTTSLLMLAIWGAIGLARLLRGGRFSYRSAMTFLFLAPAVAIAVVGLAAGGFFDIILTRLFGDDGGSAQARLGMLGVLQQIPLRALLLGADQELIESLRFSEGLEWGIENPIVRLVLYQGIAFTALILIGLGAFLAGIIRNTRSGSLMPLVTFLIVVNGSESIANKTQGLARFVTLMLIMLPRDEEEEA